MLNLINVIITFNLLLFSSCANDRYFSPRKTNTNSVSPGFTLIVPTTTVKENSNKGRVHLINNEGIVIKEWKVNFTPLTAKLDSNGLLYISGNIFTNAKKLTNGLTNIFQIRNTDNKVLFEYKNEFIHHDFTILPNGNISFLAYYQINPKAYGLKKLDSFYQGNVWPEKIIELNTKTKKIEWSWISHKHISSKSISPISKRGDLFHANSLAYIESFFMTKKPAYMFSARTISTVFIIDKETGKIIWRSPKGLFKFQHDATFTSNKSILVFNNSTRVSEVIEYNLKEKKVTWRYNGGDHLFNQSQFYSSIISGAQKLPNNNYLITLGVSGYVLEVNEKKETVWSIFNNKNINSNDVGWPFIGIFKARKYTSPTLKP